MKLLAPVLAATLAPAVIGACSTGITDFTLINADTDTEIGPLPSAFSSGVIPSPYLNVRANYVECPGDDIKSVKFYLDGIAVRCENYTPYALFGDENPTGPDLGDFGAFYGGSFTPGAIHSIKAVPYPSADCAGDPFPSLEEKFSTCSDCPGEITGFTVIDAVSDTEIGPLMSFDFTSYQGLPINVRADFESCTSGSGIDSVQFYLDGIETRCEEYTPYALFGDDNPGGPDLGLLGDFYQGTVEPGLHSIVAVPFDGPGCTGNSGCAYKEEFAVCSYCPTGYTLTTVDFSCSKDGTVHYQHGDYVDDLGYGFTLRVNPRPGGKNVNDPRIYDSDMSGGADPDLELGLGNLLIIQEDVMPDTPDDNASGGQIIFDFSAPTKIKSIGLVDTEAPAKLYFDKSSGPSWRAIGAPIPDSSSKIVELDQGDVTKLKVSVLSSFGISSIELCVRD